MAQAPQQPAKAKEPPQYKLTEPAYIHDVLYEAGATIWFDGIPGYHMEPLNDAARDMIEKHKPRHSDPIRDLTVLGPEATVLHPVRPGG